MRPGFPLGSARRRPRFSLVALLLASLARGGFAQGKPDFSTLIERLDHPLPRERARAAEALAQAAQGFRGDTTLEGRGAAWPALLAALGRRAALETEPAVQGMLALSLGRLPYLAPGEIRDAEARLLALEARSREDAAVLVDVARGLETLARLTARRAPLGDSARALLRALVRAPAGEIRVRRHGLGALLATDAADDSTLGAALAAADPELRRLALTGLARGAATGERGGLVAPALADSTPMVRLEALRAWQHQSAAAGCPGLAAASHDATPAVALTALDLLGGCAGDSLAVGALLAARGSWHARAHALVSLARAEPERARDLLPAAARGAPWQLRMYAARAAALLRDTAALGRLAADSVANVRESAISGLVQVSGHAADPVFRRALASRDYQLVRTAAGALAGSPAGAEATAPLLAALDRITRERRETSRDPRVALLTRLHELSGPALAPRLRPYLEDFDPVIADSAAALLTEWTGRAERAAPRRLPAPPVNLADAERLRGKRLRVTMARGGAFEVELLVDAAPRTVLTVVGLVRRGYYDGLTFHRVVPNFVIQGGSPGANEYMGNGPFMPDELTRISHERGTLGISTRGRDTGDAQLFVNLVGNPRLDYDYTVWGRVVSGMAVVDAVLEGDVIRRVEIAPR